MPSLLSLVFLIAALGVWGGESHRYARHHEFHPRQVKTEAALLSGTGLNGTLANGTLANGTATLTTYWLEQIDHQGVAAFNADTGYKVFRNVKDFGAKGDGKTDDTAAIQLAISSGNRCAPGKCQGSSTTPAIVYFPSGTYIISQSIIDYYYTQLIGNPNQRPIIKATPGFTGFGLIDGSQYQPGGVLGYNGGNTFYRQVKNVIFDWTDTPSGSAITGIHWPTAQATSIQNCVFKMSDSPGTQHQGFFIEAGSGGFMSDLVFHGGFKGAVFGSQQFTMRNLAFYNAVTAISQLYDWGWTYESITIWNCSVGLDMTNGGPTAPAVGSATFIDSYIAHTPIGIKTAYNANSQPATAGSLIIVNTFVKDVAIVVQGAGDVTALAGTAAGSTESKFIAAWGEGHKYVPDGPTTFQGPIDFPHRPFSLLDNGRYYERSKPQYESSPTSRFVSVRSGGAKGDGVADDTAALQKILVDAKNAGQIVFFDAGTYRITTTLRIPAESRIVGESYPVIMSSGAYWSDMANPQPVVSVGAPGESGTVEWSDMVVATQGAQPGAWLIEWNLASSGTPSGMWDVHTRIGGFTGSKLQVADCPVTPTVSITAATVNNQCIGAFGSMRVTASASGLYMENCWLWSADHDLDDAGSTQITVYAGRGLLIESKAGSIWLVGTAVEHHTLYQYQLVGTQNVFMGQIQTESAYFQPNPPATVPFPAVPALSDPDFVASCKDVVGNCAVGWGLRIVESKNVLVYGAGLYSFFDNYSTACSAVGNGATCQTRIFDLQVSRGRPENVVVYNLNTVGATSMVEFNGKSLAKYSDNLNNFPSSIALFMV